MAADRSVSVSMTLSDLERRDARVQIFPTDLRTTLVSFDLERPHLELYNTRGEGRISMGPATPPSQGTGPQRPQIFVTQMLKRDLFVVANLLFDDDA